MNFYAESVKSLILAEDWETAITHLTQIIDQEPSSFPIYEWLGLAYLLGGREEDAQECWVTGLLLCFTDLQMGEETLKAFLQGEAEQFFHQQKLGYSLVILKQVLILNSEDLVAHLQYLDLACQTGYFSLAELAELRTIEVLQSWAEKLENPQRLLEVAMTVLQEPTALSLDFLAACIPYFSSLDWLNRVMDFANAMAYDKKFISYAIDIAQVCLQDSPNNFYILNDLLRYYGLQKNQLLMLLIARKIQVLLSLNNCSLAFNCYLLSRLISAFLQGNDWLEVEKGYEHLKQMFNELLEQETCDLDEFLSSRFWALGFPLLYLDDNPQHIRPYLNRNAQIFQENIYAKSTNILDISFQPFCQNNILFKPLQRIGYIAHTLRKHSVGWLCRWLFKHHNAQDFQIYVYLIGQEADELTEQWIYPHVYRYYHFHRNVAEIVEQISQDKIQILVDLDVLTHNITAQVLAHKPAPVQVSWLGSDASGLPAIDYFLVDPYVVPPDAQSYYQETLWCLPQTYLALDGFEVGTPTLSREHLRLGEQTVVFLCVQNKIKANPSILRLQLRIIQAVPNSVFWIKGGGDNELIREMVEQLAQEIGLDIMRVMFVPTDKDEMTHRANLGLADVALDTYPYNGATTTLETLWMGVPLVTRVGEQFAARNSYSFLRQVGVQEGIAWTDEEYVAWGIRLGQDADLRQRVKERLWSARQDSPLWQGERFTREMEKAYGEMWDIYQSQ